MGREPRFYASILFDGAPWRERAETDDKVEIGAKVKSAGKRLVGKNVTELMNEIKNPEAVTVGDNNSHSAANQA